MSNLQHNKLKSGTKNAFQGTLNLSSNKVGDSNDKTNFLHFSQVVPNWYISVEDS